MARWIHQGAVVRKGLGCDGAGQPLMKVLSSPALSGV